MPVRTFRHARFVLYSILVLDSEYLFSGGDGFISCLAADSGENARVVNTGCTIYTEYKVPSTIYILYAISLAVDVYEQQKAVESCLAGSINRLVDPHSLVPQRHRMRVWAAGAADLCTVHIPGWND